MQNYKHYPKNLEILGHKIVNFDQEIRKPTEILILDNLYDQGVDFDKFSLGSKSYKRVFFNYYIKYMIEYIKTQDKKLLFVISKPINSEFFQYFDEERYLKSYKTNISSLFRLLPVLDIINTDLYFNQIVDESDPELVDCFRNCIINQKDRLTNKSYKDIKKRVVYYDLSYIDNKIFNELRYSNMFLFKENKKLMKFLFRVNSLPLTIRVFNFDPNIYH